MPFEFAASEAAKKVAGTYVADQPEPAGGLLRWLQYECRKGSLAGHVRQFVAAQEELLDPGLVLVESISAEGLICSIPCRLYDHESAGTFASAVRFSFDPASSELRRV